MMLHDHLEAHLSTPFAWGSHDCVTFAAAWVHECTGTDPLAGLKPWKTKRQALARIAGVGGLEKAIDGMLQRIDPNFAMDGDLAMAGGNLMLFSGAFIVGPCEHGLQSLSRSQADAAWMVRRG